MTLPPTRFTRLVGSRLPIQQAGMGGVTTPALAAAVAAAGGLGMVAAAGLTADQVDAQVRAALDLAGHDARIGVNFLMPFLDDPALDAASQVARLVECFYGDPDPAIVERVHDGGALAAWQVGSLTEARAAVDVGCDVIVVQGVEAGGHVRGTTPLLALLDQVRDAVDLPLIAAGGIGLGAAMAEALLAGADAVRVGTRFVATREADAHPSYRDALIAAGADDTVLTEAFSMGWPHAPHRVLRQCVSRRRPAGHLRLRRLRGSRPSRRCRPPTAATPPTVRMTEVGSKLYVDAEYLTEPDRTIGETDDVRRALARALEELDLDAWLTVEFSADPTWDEPPPVH